MKKSQQSGSALIIGIIITVVIMAGGAAIFMATSGGDDNNEPTKNETSSESESESNTQDNQTNESATGVDTMPLVKTALQGNGDVKCTANTKTEDGEYIITTMYIKDRDNILLEIPNDSGKLNSLFVDQANSYTWAEGNDRGTKSPLTKDDRSIEVQWQENIDDLKNDNNAELNCTQTNLEDSLFEIPSSVTFSDLGQFVN